MNNFNSTSRWILFALLIFISSALYSAPRIVTYNTGLAHTFVPYAKERLPVILSELRTKSADVLCLQEVWLKKDRKRFLKELSGLYPFNHFNPIKQTRSAKKPTCKVKQIIGKDKFVSCMLKECKGKKGDEFTDCILETCGDSLRRLKERNRECATAIMAQVGKSPVKGLWNVINPFRAAGLFAYKGGTGLLLLSKYPLTNLGSIDFSDISTLNRRMALTAQVNYPEGEISVVCTHLTANLERSVPYTGISESWGDENKKQVERLLSNLDNGERSVVLGDFNCSLADPANGIDGDLEESCELMIEQFEDPLSQNDPRCTNCSYNTLNIDSSNPVDEIIDHIYLRGFGSLESGVCLDETREIELKDGTTIESHLSDHFGGELLLNVVGE